MPHTIRVRILNRDFSLVVEEEDEQLMRDLAEYVNQRIKAFRSTHPEQPEVTAAVITAVAIAEELFIERNKRESLERHLDAELGGLADMLTRAVEAAS